MSMNVRKGPLCTVRTTNPWEVSKTNSSGRHVGCSRVRGRSGSAPGDPALSLTFQPVFRMRKNSFARWAVEQVLSAVLLVGPLMALIYFVWAPAL